MASSELDSLCYVCYVQGNKDLLHCNRCKVTVHQTCANLFSLEEGSTHKKVKLEKSIYNRVRPCPQLSNDEFKDWFTAWVCDKCLEGATDQTTCEFCQLKDGLFVKVKFYSQDKKGKRKVPDSEFKWAHLNCILKLYGHKPKRSSHDKCYLLEENQLANAPECKRCGPPYKMDIKCRTCNKYYAHNLCLADDKPLLKLCTGCDKNVDIQGKLDSNSSGIYMQRVLQDLVDSDKYNEFCVKKGEKSKAVPTKQTGRKKVDESKVNNDPDKEENQVTDHFLKFNEKNELVYVFPFAKKDMFVKQETSAVAPEETEMKVETLRIPPLEPRNSSDYLSFPPINFEGMEPLGIRENFEMTDVETLMARNEDLDFQNLMKNEEGLFNFEGENMTKKEESSMNVEENKPTANNKAKKQIFKIIRAPAPEKQQKPKPKKKEKEKGLDILAEKVENWHYISSVQILKELQKIYKNKTEGKDDSEKARLTKKFYELLEDLQDKASSSCLKSYDEKMAKEIAAKFSLYEKYRVQCETWPMVPQTFRRYEWIEDYVPSVDTKSFKDEIKKTLSSKKKHCCKTSCACSDLATLGPYVPEKQLWETTCPGRMELMECDENCGCDLSVCKNRSIATGQRKKLNVDLKETFCWGLDYATHNNILLVLPEYKDIDKNDFIEKRLLRAVHLTQTPWDMIAVCKQIIIESRKGSTLYKAIDRKLAKMLIRAIKFVNNFDTTAFRLHTKGYGVVCMREGGIPANDMIAEYFGEIYTPWRWFEKQDLIKRFCKEKNKKDELPDFYNIMLEKHKDDPCGYDILIVDPINKGNYSSRFSHSCDPNCGTVTTVTNAKYGVAMYSLKAISFGEELTFDYFSVTENEKEYKQAICLCGSRHCRIHYLNLLTSKNQNQYLEENLSFLESINLISSTCLEPLNEEDQQALDQYSFHESIIGGCPTWFVKWIALVLMFIRKEKDEYVNFSYPKRKQELEVQLKQKPVDRETLSNLKKHLHLEKLNLEGDRIQNLTITVNKIKHVMNLIREKGESGYTISKTKIKRNPDSSKTLNKSVINQPPAQEPSPQGQQPLPRALVAPLEPMGLSSKFPPPEFFKNDFMEKLDLYKGSSPEISGSNNESPANLNPQPSSGSESVGGRFGGLPGIMNKSEEEGNKDERNSRNQNEDENMEDLELPKMSVEEDREASQKDELFDKRNVELEAPLRKVDLNSVCNAFWDLTKTDIVEEVQTMHSITNPQKSEFIINELRFILKRWNVRQEVDDAVEATLSLARKTFETLNGDYEAKFYILRRIFLKISNILRTLPNAPSTDWRGISDILYFYSLTFTYVTQNNYPQVCSEKEATVRRCDIPDFSRYFEKIETTPEEEAQVLKHDTKTYGSSYILAQLTIWYKQTVEKPETSLSMEKRGTLCYPSFRESFVDTYLEGIEANYPYKTRENWIKKMLECPDSPWPTSKGSKKQSHSWHYKNEIKMYGTFLLDRHVFKDKDPNIAEKVITTMDKSEEEKLQLFHQLNSVYFEKINYTLPPYLKTLFD